MKRALAIIGIIVIGIIITIIGEFYPIVWMAYSLGLIGLALWVTRKDWGL